MMRKVLTSAAAVIGLGLAGLLGGVAFFTTHAYVTTPSMWPAIPPGSMVFVQHESSYHVGDVIDFHGNGLDYTHRIIKISPSGVITTKGDNPENSPDLFMPPTTRADVIGEVVAAPRWLGFPELIAHHPGYGLAWLRTELGLWGKIVLAAAVGAVAWLAIRPRRGERTPAARPQPVS
jgi:signal peptidase I